MASLGGCGGRRLLLADGVALCNLVNALKPGVCKPPSPSGNPALQRRNIEWFLKAATELGVADHDLFEVPDLYDGKHMRGVLATVHAVGLVAASMPGCERMHPYRPPHHPHIRTIRRALQRSCARDSSATPRPAEFCAWTA